MKVFTTAALAALALAPSALARVFFVQVGAEYQRVGFRAEERTQVVRFAPNNVFAVPGDIIRFQMVQADHQLSESRLDTPCSRRDGGFSSGFVRNQFAEQVQTWDYLVTDNGPRVFFDEQDNFCQLGNFFSVNPRGNPFNQGYNGFNNGNNGGFGQISGTTQSSRNGRSTSTSTTSTATSVANATQLTTAPTSAFLVASGSAIPIASNFFNGGTSSATTTATGSTTSTTGTSTSASASIISTLTNGVTLATGTGTTSSGDQCSCQCLCGSDSFGSGQGMGNFGGVGSGPMPSMIGVM